jgi:predicted secreted acid phosphatase
VYGSWETVLYNKNDVDEKQLEDKKKYVRSYDPAP